MATNLSSLSAAERKRMSDLDDRRDEIVALVSEGTVKVCDLSDDEYVLYMDGTDEYVGPDAYVTQVD